MSTDAKKSWSSELAAWVVSHSDAIGLVSVIGLFYVNFMFNYDYGKLMASGPDSETKFAIAFGLLESSALFLAGYMAIKGQSESDKAWAGGALAFLLVLSFWTCYSSILASDARAKWDGKELAVHNTLDSIRDVERNIALTEDAIAALNPSLPMIIVNAMVGRKEVSHMNMEDLQKNLKSLREQKADLSKRIKKEDNIERPQFAVFREVGGMLGVHPESVRMASRLMFGFAVIFAYCIVFRALVAKVLSSNGGDSGK